MGNDIRKGNRTSVPSRGGLRRSNTPPPPTVRLGIDGQPETEPISTSRPRGNELPKTAPILENPPADVIAAATPPESLPPKAPEAVAVEKVVPAEPAPIVATKAAPPAAQATDRTTLHSQPESQPVPQTAAQAAAPVEVNAPDEAVNSQAAPSVAPKRSLPPANRKRGSNLKGALGKSIPPPPAQVEVVTAPVVPRAVAEEASTAKAPPVADAPDAEEAAPESKPAAVPAHAPDIDEHFFDRGEHAADTHNDASDLESYDERMAQKNSPEARARRAKNWRYVLIAGAVCVLVLLVANVMNLTGRRGPSSDQAVASSTSVAVTPPVASAAPKADLPPEPPVQVTVQPAASGDMPVGAAAPSAKAAEPGTPAPADSSAASKGWVAEPTASASAAVAVVSPPAAVAAEPTADDKKSAAQEKHACQTLLDQGAFAKAVEAGEHSVALDPADGEAWLMLGAAYQSMGKNAEARRTFSSCAAEAKRGPINECRAMLR